MARIVAEVEKKTKTIRIEIRLILEEGPNGSPRLRKEILVDGVKRKAVEALGEVNAVTFLPQMLRILEGSPEDRRRYINMVLSQVVPGYGQALSLYARALEQRNALLKLLAERGGDTSQLDYWDNLLAGNGAAIISWRARALQELEKTASTIHQNLTAGDEILKISYQPSYSPPPFPTNAEDELLLQMKSKPVSWKNLEFFEKRKSSAGSRPAAPIGMSCGSSPMG